VWWTIRTRVPRAKTRPREREYGKCCGKTSPRFCHFAPGSFAVEQQIFSKDTVSHLTDIHVPTLIIAVKKIMWTRRSNYDRWAKEFQREGDSYPRAAHLVNIDRPKEFQSGSTEFSAKALTPPSGLEVSPG